MPWKEMSPKMQKVAFLAAWRENTESMTELWYRFKTWVTLQVQDMGNTLPPLSPSRFGEMACPGERLVLWTNVRSLC